TDTFPKGIEIITWLDDCTRYALHVSAHRAITTHIVKATFRKAAGQHGIPASTLTDNGMVYTVRLAGIGRRGGRNGFEQQLRDWHADGARPEQGCGLGPVEPSGDEGVEIAQWSRRTPGPTTPPPAA